MNDDGEYLVTTTSSEDTKPTTTKTRTRTRKMNIAQICVCNVGLINYPARPHCKSSLRRHGATTLPSRRHRTAIAAKMQRRCRRDCRTTAVLIKSPVQHRGAYSSSEKRRASLIPLRCCWWFRLGHSRIPLVNGRFKFAIGS